MSRKNNIPGIARNGIIGIWIKNPGVDTSGITV
jgi:hypothetical protein